jgi:hypothetical protein
MAQTRTTLGIFEIVQESEAASKLHWGDEGRKAHMPIRITFVRPLTLSRTCLYERPAQATARDICCVIGAVIETNLNSSHG